MSNSISINKKSVLFNNAFPIVGIGASAGGMEAMSQLLENLPSATGLCFIYIQHLDPDYKSNLAEILQRSTAMRVITAEDKMHVEPDNMYVIPPNKELSINNEIIRLTTRPDKPTLTLPINFFFLSLAENYKERCIGIVLSGMASDGALGLKAIKQAGGITYAQNETAKFGSMPKAAIAEGAAGAVLSPKEIAGELARISKNGYLFNALSDGESAVGDKEKDNNDVSLKDELTTILQLLKNAHGIDFTHYKKNTIKRRIIRRLLIHKLETIDEYIAFIKQNPDEINNLYNDLLINVTHFFRDAEASLYLKEKILPRLLKNKTINDPLRIWVAACSTGEEAYSMAILVLEVLGDKPNNIPVQIFATDLSEIAIAKARVGIYSPVDVQMISNERLQRYFAKVDGHFRISKAIRDICIFAPHNIFRDPPFSRVDIISCCNVLIYLDNVLQKKIMSNFHYALNNNGFLVLGQSETIGNNGQLFTLVEKKLKIYSKKNDTHSRAMFDLRVNYPSRETFHTKSVKVVEADFSSNLNLERLVDKLILTDFSPAGVVVNHDLDILQFRGSTSLYLEPAPGQASLNLLKMARIGLSFELRNAANKVIKTGEAVRKSGIEINHKGSIYQVSINVTPINTGGESSLLLIVFEEMKFPQPNTEKGRNSKDRLVKQLENELLSLREDMRSVLEAQEAANEELQSANEEILSSNEELQSINEELETSKEEIESSNEELITINQELLVRNDQLAESNNYIEAVIATIRESVLILDSTFRVKSANEAFYRTFQTDEKNTEGILVFELGGGDWKIPKLKETLEGLVHQKTYYHGLEIKHSFKEIGEKIFLVNAKKVQKSANQQEVYLLAFEDITEHKKAERLLEEREAWLRNMTDNLPVMIWVATPDKNLPI